MEASITEFIQSEAGLILATILLLVGLCDLLGGHYIARYRPELLPLPSGQLKKFMTLIYFISSFLVLIGLYMLYVRA